MRDSCLVKVTVSEKRNFSILCLHNRTFTQVTNFQKAFFVYIHINFQKAIFCLPVFKKFEWIFYTTLKLRFSEKATKFDFFSSFLAFSECLNFTAV